jgi:tetratricopeptide (TPR) repeat protein
MLPESSSPDVEALLTSARSSLGTPLKTVELCGSLLDHPRAEFSAHDFCEVHFLHGFALRLLGELGAAESELLFAKQVADHLHDDLLRARSAQQLGTLYMEQHQGDAALGNLELAVTLFRSQGRIDDEGQALFMLSNLQWELGDRAIARSTMDQALMKFTLADSTNGITAVYCGLASMYMDDGNYEQAIEALNLCKRLLPSSSHEKNHILVDLQLATAYLKLGRYEHAEDLLHKVVQRAQTGGYHFLQSKALFHLHQLLAARNDEARSQEYLAAARSLAQSHGFEPALNAHMMNHSG